MLKFLLITAAALLSSQASAQEVIDNAEKCLKITYTASGFEVANGCGYPLHLEALNARNDQYYEREVKPDASAEFPGDTFGTACRLGYRSELRATNENRAEIRKAVYRCLKK